MENHWFFTKIFYKIPRTRFSIFEAWEMGPYIDFLIVSKGKK